MQMNPYLIFNGDCEAAFKFYEQSLGGKIEMMLTHGNSPMEETFWAVRFGMLVDQFGTPWMVNCEKKEYKG